MNSIKLTRTGGVAVLTLSLGLLSGCSGSEDSPQVTGSSSAPPTQSPTEAPTPTPTPTLAAEEPESIDTVALGEKIVLEGLDLTVDTLERVDKFPNECGGAYTPQDGRSLTAIGITVTNTSKDIDYPDGQYLGQSSVTFRDTEGRQMQFVFPDCKLVGEDTFEGLMPGATASRPLLIEGSPADSAAGWIELQPFGANEPYVVLLDPNLVLYADN